MDPKDVQKVIDQLFLILEGKVSNPWLLDLIRGINVTADSLIETIASELSNPPTTQQFGFWPRSLMPYPPFNPYGPYNPNSYTNNPFIAQAESLRIPWLQIMNTLMTGGITALEALIAAWTTPVPVPVAPPSVTK